MGQISLPGASIRALVSSNLTPAMTLLCGYGGRKVGVGAFCAGTVCPTAAGTTSANASSLDTKITKRNEARPEQRGKGQVTRPSADQAALDPNSLTRTTSAHLARIRPAPWGDSV